MSESDFLLHIWFLYISLVWIPYISEKNKDMADKCSNEHLVINLAKLSDWGMPDISHHYDMPDVICYGYKRINHFQLDTNFPALSLHFRFGSVAPRLTLKANVAISIPKPRYRRLVRPYLVGFPPIMLF